MVIVSQILTAIAVTAMFLLEGTTTHASTPLPSQFYSPQQPMYQNITFVVHNAKNLRQAVRTVTLANKRQQAGIKTIILFQSTAVTLSVVQGIPYGEITAYDTDKLHSNPQEMPICPKSTTENVPPVVPEITLPDAPKIYLPILKNLLITHAKLGGKIVLCPCCDRISSEQIEFLPKEITPEKFQHLKKQMKIKEGGY